MLYKIIILLGVLMSLSCRSVYPRPEFANFATPPRPLAVLKEFRSNNLTKATLYQNAIIDVKGRSMPAIGLCAYDTDRNYIALSLLTPTGIKLIEVAEFNGKRRKAFAMPEIASGEKATNGIADDVKRIYFQPKSKPLNYYSDNNSIIFYWTFKDRKIELKFGKSPNKAIGNTLLLEKHIFIKNKLIGSVFYYDYKKVKDLIINKKALKPTGTLSSKVAPMRIRYENYEYDYSLILKNNEVIEGE